MKNKLSILFGIGALIAPILMLFLLGHIVYESLPALQQIGGDLLRMGAWKPLNNNPSYSLIPALTGTLYVAGLAVLIAVPVGVCCAILLSVYAKGKIVHICLALIDLMAGIPSVIFGFIGLVVLVKALEQIQGVSSGESVLAAALLLSVMLLPYIVSNCWEAIESAKEKWMPSALALGFSKEYALKKILLPGIHLGIRSSILMAFGRAIGETMAVMMVIGNSPIAAKLSGRSITVAGLTALEIGSAEYHSLHMSAIYAANLILILILAGVLFVGHRWKKMQEAKNDET